MTRKPIASIDEGSFIRPDGTAGWCWQNTPADRSIVLVAHETTMLNQSDFPKGVEWIENATSFERNCMLHKVRHPALSQHVIGQPLEVILLDELIHRVSEWEKLMAFPKISYRPELWRKPTADEFGMIWIECWYWFAGNWWLANMGSDEAKGERVLVRVDPKLKTVNDFRAKDGLPPLPDERGEQVITPNGIGG